MKKFNFIFDVFTPIILGTIIGFLFKDDFSYLNTLNRTLIVPPFVFIAVWSVLYILMGTWYYLFNKSTKNEVINSIYWISLFVNLMFVPILFSMNNLLLALIDVIFLFFLIVILFIYSSSKKEKYAYLLLPYLLWLMMASILMADLLVNNPL